MGSIKSITIGVLRQSYEMQSASIKFSTPQILLNARTTQCSREMVVPALSKTTTGKSASPIQSQLSVPVTDIRADQAAKNGCKNLSNDLTNAVQVDDQGILKAQGRPDLVSTDQVNAGHIDISTVVKAKLSEQFAGKGVEISLRKEQLTSGNEKSVIQQMVTVKSTEDNYYICGRVQLIECNDGAVIPEDSTVIEVGGKKYEVVLLFNQENLGLDKRDDDYLHSSHAQMELFKALISGPNDDSALAVNQSTRKINSMLHDKGQTFNQSTTMNAYTKNLVTRFKRFAKTTDTFEKDVLDIYRV